MSQGHGRRPTTTEIDMVVEGRELLVRKRRLVADPTRPRRAPRLPAVEEAAAEARWLATARHPGVVALRRATPEVGTIEVAHAGGATVASGRWTPPVAAGFLSSACTTVADLHRRRLVHGKLTADHLLVAPSGRGGVTLCSPAGAGDDPSDDRRALAAIVTGLLDGWTGESGSGPSGHRAPHAGRRPATRAWAEVLETLGQPGGLLPAARLLHRLASDEPAGPVRWQRWLG